MTMNKYKMIVTDDIEKKILTLESKIIFWQIIEELLTTKEAEYLRLWSQKNCHEAISRKMGDQIPISRNKVSRARIKLRKLIEESGHYTKVVNDLKEYLL